MRQHPSSIFLLVTTGLATALAGCTTTVRQSPDFAARRGQINALAVVPPEVKLQLITFQGDNPRLPDEEANLRGCLPGLVESAFESRGFMVRDPNLLQASLVQSADLRLQATQANAAYVEAAHEAYGAQPAALTSKAENYRRSLGPAVSSLADRAGADALVVIEMEGFKKTGGEIAKDIAKTVLIAAVTLGNVVVIQATQGAVLCVALVDASNGNILWQNVALTQSDFSAPGVVEGMVQQLFTGLPAGVSGGTVAERTNAAPVIAAPATTPATVQPAVVAAPAPAAVQPAAAPATVAERVRSHGW